MAVNLPLFPSLVYTAESAKAIADAVIELTKRNPHVQYEMLKLKKIWRSRIVNLVYMIF